ncbi:MAG: retroviral-like aspartic protease family protein [Caldilineaceae bacterium]
MNIYSYDYDSSYNPSAPVVEISIGPPLASPTLTLTALIDSGADTVIIPVYYLKQIGAYREQKAWIRNVAGSRALVDLYSISLRIGPFSFADLLVVGGPQRDEIILGRDALNHFIVTLNGLANVVEISQ